MAALLGWLAGLFTPRRAAVVGAVALMTVSGTVVVNFQSPSWPTAANTGYTNTLSAYAGGCSLSSGTVTIDSKDIAAACSNLFISGTATVTITQSKLNTLQVTGTGAHLTISDSTINGGNQNLQAAIGVWGGPQSGQVGFTGTRLNVSGGKDGLECDLSCNLQDSYLHDWVTPPNGTHMQAFLHSGGPGTSSSIDSRITVNHNSLECKVFVQGDTGGCTADLSLFGDGGIVSGVTVTNNLMKNGNGYQTYCAALGYNPGKNYPNPDHVTFTGNVFEVGVSGKCGDSSHAAFWKRAADGATGNVWSNNTTVDGTVIPEPASG